MMAKRLASAELQSGSLLAAAQPHQASGAQKNPATIFGRNTSLSARSKEPRANRVQSRASTNLGLHAMHIAENIFVLGGDSHTLGGTNGVKSTF